MIKKRILCLPGWDERCSVFDEIKILLNDYFEFIYVEFPGFSNNEYPEKAYFPIDYAEYVYKKVNEEYDIILAHSYGGKVALELYFQYKKTPLILLAPAIIKPKRKIKTKIKIIMYKIMKKLNLLNKKKEYGSIDYLNSKGIMKKVFLNAINTYYDNNLTDIFDKVLLIYGKKDKQTSFKEGRRINKLIKRSKLSIIDGDHYVLYKDSFSVSKIIYHFLRDEE